MARMLGGGLSVVDSVVTTTRTWEHLSVTGSNFRICTVEGGGAVDDVTVVLGEEESLKVACSPSPVRRGETVSCSATKGGKPAAVAGWKFERQGTTVQDLSTSGDWIGTAIVDGVVTATLSDGTVASTTLHVSSRLWTETATDRVVLEYLGCSVVSDTCRLRYPPTQQHGQLGYLEFAPKRFALAERAATVSVGPNRGWQYFSGTDRPVVHDRAIIILNKALQVGDPIYQKQAELHNTDPEVFCAPEVFPRHVYEHEMVHFALYRSRWHQRHVNAWIEQHVGYTDPVSFREQLIRMDQAVIGMAYEAADITHSGMYPPEPSCLFTVPAHTLRW